MAKETTLEKAIREGRRTITAEEAAGLRGKAATKKKGEDKLIKSQTTKDWEVYKKKVKKMGAKGTGIPTRDEFRIIQARMKKRYPMAKAIVSSKKTTPDYTTTRTEAVEGSLRQAGLTEEEIKRLRGR